MKKFLIAIILISLVFSAEVEKNTLTTFGEFDQETPPDVVYLSLGVQRDGFTAEEAQEVLKKDAGKVLEALAENNIEREKIKTDSFALYPVYRPKKIENTPEDNEQPEILKYRAYIRFMVEMSQVTQVGKVLDSAVKSGVNRIESITFSVKQKDKAIKDGLREAINKAEEKAALIASGFNVEILGPISISESYRDYDSAPYGLSLMERSNAPELPAGKVKIKSRVDVTYEIKRNPRAQKPNNEVVTQAPTENFGQEPSGNSLTF